MPGRQLMEDRWPGGEETPFIPSGSSGSPTLAWRSRDNRNGMMDDGDLGRGQGMAPRLGDQPPPDPFAMERPPVLSANGGGGAAAAAQGGGALGGGEIRAKPPARYAVQYCMEAEITGLLVAGCLAVEWTPSFLVSRRFLTVRGHRTRLLLHLGTKYTSWARLSAYQYASVNTPYM